MLNIFTNTMKGIKMLTKTFKKIFIFVAVSMFSFNLHAADWTMASGYPKSNFHTQNIIKFIEKKTKK